MGREAPIGERSLFGQQRTSIIDIDGIDLRIETTSSLCLSRCFG